MRVSLFIFLRKQIEISRVNLYTYDCFHVKIFFFNAAFDFSAVVYSIYATTPSKIWIPQHTTFCELPLRCQRSCLGKFVTLSSLEPYQNVGLNVTMLLTSLFRVKKLLQYNFSGFHQRTSKKNSKQNPL